MTVDAQKIRELREKSGAGVLECKIALEENDGDIEKALEVLHEKGLARAADREGRETNAGVLDLYTHGEGRVGVMVEVNCETDFVARTEEFRTFAHEIALQVAANSPKFLSREAIPEEVIGEYQQELRTEAKEDGKPDNIIDRIVDGRLEKYYQEQCLLQQRYIRDDEKTVEDLKQELIATVGENITIRRFVRWEVGGE